MAMQNMIFQRRAERASRKDTGCPKIYLCWITKVRSSTLFITRRIILHNSSLKSGKGYPPIPVRRKGFHERIDPAGGGADDGIKNIAFGRPDAWTDQRPAITQNRAIIRAEGLETIEAVPLYMNQLFINLLANALKFAKKGVPPFLTIKGVNWLKKKSKRFSLCCRVATTTRSYSATTGSGSIGRMQKDLQTFPTAKP
jgi:hypothetical protein